jgi:hypothetical protein
VKKKPEKMPPSLGLQGVLKSDWTTEWFLGENWKTICSPIFAEMVSGVKVRPFFPTETVWAGLGLPVPDGAETDVEVPLAAAWCVGLAEAREKVLRAATMKDTVTILKKEFGIIEEVKEWG